MAIVRAWPVTVVQSPLDLLREARVPGKLKRLAGGGRKLASE